MAQKIHNKKINKVNQNWNFGPDISNCKSVKYLVNYLSKNIDIKFSINQKLSAKFKPETNILRLNNTKSKQKLKWKPKWNINQSLDKILEWNNDIKNSKPYDVCLKQIKSYLYE